MTTARFAQIFENIEEKFTPEEIAEGWHFCADFDGLPIGPGSPWADCCACNEEPSVTTAAILAAIKAAELAPLPKRQPCTNCKAELPCWSQYERGIHRTRCDKCGWWQSYAE